MAKLLSKMNADIGENNIAKKYNMVYNQYKKAAFLVRQVSVYTAMCREPEGVAAIPALHR